MYITRICYEDYIHRLMFMQFTKLIYFLENDKVLDEKKKCTVIAKILRFPRYGETNLDNIFRKDKVYNGEGRTALKA